eukprot:CAMPEP_0174261196 /NCGR_PEP_ID=MMETSP0439-20130205/11288_1 /TAXON_ID=0 /ORGANISM="Stereomyxa ramosa, Strain Chinc5" /LENGTH=703 /DNA_ID=CAMNT_0015345635 /DNA_START=49 /DNA_END=2160 /DNA_ORIENTATION=-
MGNVLSAGNRRELGYLQELSSRAKADEAFTMTDEDTERLLRALNSKKIRLVEWSANTITDLCKSNGENRVLVGTQNGVQSLVYCLRKAKSRKTQGWLIAAIGNVCISNEDNAEALLKSGGLRYIIKALKAKSVQNKRYAANTIAILCVSNEKAQKTIQEEGAVPLLINCVESKHSHLKRWGIFALGNMCEQKKTQSILVKRAIVPPLVEILGGEHEDDTKRWSCNILGILCAKHAQIREECRKAKAPQALISLVKDSRDLNVVRNAVFAMGKCCIDHSANKKKVIDLGGVTMLINILQTGKNVDDKLKLACAGALINIIDNDDNFPKKIRSLLDEARDDSRVDVERKLVDLIDADHSIAMRLKKKAPRISQFFEEPLQLEESMSSDDNSKLKNKGKIESEEIEESSGECESSSYTSYSDVSDDDEDDVGHKFVISGDVEYDHLQIGEEIGCGSFGVVYKGTYKGVPVAVKEMFFSENEHIQRLIDREVQTLKGLTHPNIVSYMGFCVHVTGTYLVTQYAEGGDLRTLLKSNNPLSWKERISIAMDVAKAMSFVHSEDIIHRDLKSKNILLTAEKSALLCDFGFARESVVDENGAFTQKVGTNQWMAPEVIMGCDYTSACDVFSYGMVLVELLTREKPPHDRRNIFDTDKFEEMIQEKIKAQRMEFNGQVQKLMELAEDCIERKPEFRPDFAQITASLDKIIAL